MILKITQKIIYEIDGTINFGFNKLLLTPQNNESQKILDWKIDIQGGKKELNSKDQFGNQIENISKIITSASKIFDKYSDVKTAIKGALQSYKTHADQLQNIVTKSWGSQGLEKQIKKLEDEHGVMPGKQIPEIPPEQSNVSEVADPEEEKDKLN